jgi:hypothetical protein
MAFSVVLAYGNHDTRAVPDVSDRYRKEIRHMQALFTLTPAESKRLIGKGIAALPEIRKAQKNGYLLVGRGSTNAYIVEELLHKKIAKERYVAGQTVLGTLCVLGPEDRIQPITFHKGKPLRIEPSTVLDKLTPGDLFLKGANALDAKGNIGIIMASPAGGTVGQFYVPLQARGLDVIYPVGLEKLVPSVEDAAKHGGIFAIEKSIGVRVGMICIPGGRVFTEINAVQTLFGIDAFHFASGGWGGAEGAVTLVVEGPDVKVKKCLEFVERKVKGEPALPPGKSACKTCTALTCSFAGKETGKLPDYLEP